MIEQTRRVAALILLIALFSTSHAIRLEESTGIPDPSAIQLDVHQFERGHYIVRFTTPQLQLQDITSDGKTWTLPELSGESRLWQIGAPALPAVNRAYRIQNTGGFSVKIHSTKFHDLTNIAVIPEQSPADSSSTVFTTPGEQYHRNEWYPQQLFATSEPAILRDARVILLGVHPVQYNPITQTLRVYNEIELEIEPTNEPSRNELLLPSRPVPSFASLYRNVIGAEDLVTESETAAPGQILIVARNVTQVRTVLNAFVQWKTKRGQPVQILAPNGSGTAVADVQSIITNAYNSWNPPLESVLLVGDGGSEATQFELPTYYVDNYYSDHPYMQLAGNDILADVPLGRISVTTLSELQTFVNRTINYERNPSLTDTTWFTRGWGYAGVSHDVNSNRASIRYCLSMMNRVGVTETPYDEHSGVVNVSLINQRLNPGATFWAHRPAWVGEITPANLTSLNNINKPFVSVNMTCGSGDWYGTAITGIHEQLIRLGTPTTPKGALAAMSTESPDTHPATNNIIACGTFQALGILDARQPGPMYLNGKFQLWRNYWLDQPSVVNDFSHWNNIMGDVTANVWTGVPHPLQLEAHDQLELSQNSVSVAVRDVAGNFLPSAWVTAWKLNASNVTESYSRAITNEQGIATLPVTNATTGSLFLTATYTHPGFNAIPAVDTVQIVTTSTRPVVQSVAIDDDNNSGTSGNGNGFVNPGEIVDVSVTLQNAGSSTLTNLRSRITSTDNRITIINDSTDWPSISPNASAASTIPYRIRFHSTLRNADTVWFALNGIGGSLRIPIQSIRVQVVSDSVIGHSVWNAGVTGQLTVRIQNAGGLALSTPTTATLRCDNPLVQITDASAVFSTLPLSGEVTNLSDTWTATPNRVIVPGTQVTFHIHFSNDNIEDDVSYIRTIGNRSTFDPTGPDRYGYRLFDDSDIGYPQTPVYQWVEILPSRGGNGTRIAISDTGYNLDASSIIPLPFPVRYYGERFDSATICSNGWLAFGAQPYFDNFRNYHLPAQEGPRYLVAPFWDDLFFDGADDGVFVWQDVINHRYVVTWNAASLANSLMRNEFQLIVYDPVYYPTPTGDAPLRFQYKMFHNVDGAALEPGFATIGIADGDYRNAVEYSCYNRYTSGSSPITDSDTANRAILLTTAAPDTLLHWISPIAGDSIAISYPVTLCWSGRTSLSSVRLQLNRSYPSEQWETILDNTENDGIESWTVTGAVTNTARFRVMSLSGSEGDTVRGNISFVAPQAFLRVSTPNGGEQLIVGIDHRIEWTHSIIPGTLRIQLNRNYPSDSWQTLFDSVSVAADGVPWTVTLTVSNNARLRIIANDVAGISDTCDANFSIVMPPLLALSPNPVDATVMLNDTMRVSLSLSNSGGATYNGTLTPETGHEGFWWLENGDPSGPRYEWIDTDNGEFGPWSTDITSDSIRLPFDFPYFGTNYRYVWMCTNGWLTLDNPSENATHSNQLMPYNTFGAMLAVFWDYLSVPEGATRYLLDSANQRAVFSWNNVRRNAQASARLKFQAILEANGNVTFQYDSLTTNSWDQTVGIQNTDHSFYTTLFFTEELPWQKAIRFSQLHPWATVSQTTFSIPPTNAQNFSILFDARGGFEEEDLLVGRLVFGGNAVNAPYNVPVSMFTVLNRATETITQPSSYTLEQNFPNPFNPTTEIHFRLDKLDRVRIDVFNAEGRLVTTLVNSFLPAGRHSIHWNGKENAAGIYFYRMTTSSASLTRKMLLIK